MPEKKKTFIRARANETCGDGLYFADEEFAKVRRATETARKESLSAQNSATSALNAAAAVLEVAIDTLNTVRKSEDVKFDAELDAAITVAADALNIKQTAVHDAADALDNSVDAMKITALNAGKIAQITLDAADKFFETALDIVRKNSGDAAAKTARRSAQDAVLKVLAQARKANTKLG